METHITVSLDDTGDFLRLGDVFSCFFRMIQTAFIDMENMFDLLDEKQEVKDVEDASELDVKQGVVEFRDVQFHYEER